MQLINQPVAPVEAGEIHSSHPTAFDRWWSANCERRARRNRHMADAASRLGFSEQVVGRTPESFPNSQERGHQEVHAARFNFLDRSRVEVRQFGESLLRHFAGHPLPAHVRAKAFQLGCLNSI
jgi:hypothetical protein